MTNEANVWQYRGSVECEGRVSSVAFSKRSDYKQRFMSVSYKNGQIGYIDTLSSEVRQTLVASQVPCGQQVDKQIIKKLYIESFVEYVVLLGFLEFIKKNLF